MSDDAFRREYMLMPMAIDHSLCHIAKAYIDYTESFDRAICGRLGIPRNSREARLINENARATMRRLSDESGYLERDILTEVRNRRRFPDAHA